MATTTTLPPQPGASFLSTDPELAAVDVSVRGPVLTCFLTSVHWLVLGTVLLVYASSLTHPVDTITFPFGIPSPFTGLNELANNFSFFTYGHVWPAAMDALVYGWATTAGLGLAIWVLARTCRTPLRAPGLLVVAIVFWNLGVTIGLSGIFLGASTSIELLEFCTPAMALMWLALALFSMWAIVSFLARRPGPENHAQSWILSGLIAFPWLLASGSILLSSHRLPGSNVIQGLLSAWYVHGLYTLWLAPIALGLLFYLIPKASGMPLRFSGKADLAFWSWLILAPWTAVHDLVGGPFPASTVSFGLILSGLIFLPVALIGLSLVKTAFEGEERRHGGVVLPFLTLATVMFVVAGIFEQILSIRSANMLLRFTMFREADTLVWVYGFFSFTAYGAMYYIVPRLINFGWRSSRLILVHYYASVYGILLVIAMLGFGGVMEGFTLENSDPQVTMATVTQLTISFHIATTMCLSLVAIGNGIFALHLGWTLVDWLFIQARRNPLAAELLLEDYEPAPVAAPEREVAA